VDWVEGRRFSAVNVRFGHRSRGVALLIAAAVALIWANSTFADSYYEFWHLPLSVGIGKFLLAVAAFLDQRRADDDLLPGRRHGE
jgi:Na+/H+ antiporter NhaA